MTMPAPFVAAVSLRQGRREGLERVARPGPPGERESGGRGALLPLVLLFEEVLLRVQQGGGHQPEEGDGGEEERPFAARSAGHRRLLTTRRDERARAPSPRRWRTLIIAVMEAVRPAAVAGSFYPGDPDGLRETVCRLLAAAPGGTRPKALIAPHAGYVYSGPVAASAYRRIENAPVTRVVLLGPSHYTHLHGVALPDSRAMRTPLGDVGVEDAGLPRSARAHSLEHSLEVQLPFLQLTLASFTLVPLAVGEAMPEEIAAVLEKLWGGPETLIVVSSDLSHYLPYPEAQRADAATAKEILALGLLRHEDACGAVAINGLLHEARRRVLRAELIELRNSGDTAGDRSRVVGYGAFAFHERAA